jgi:GT2 family glycosyltransferase
MVRIAVLITCYNRRDLTVACLTSLRDQSDSRAQTVVYLVDDGCSDGTAAAAAKFSDVNILHGDGNLFWTRGTHLAFDAALRDGYDGYLWLNDDVVLDRDALGRLLASSERAAARSPLQHFIVVGSTRDPDTGEVTYGGVNRRGRFRPLSFVRISPSETEIEVDTMEGNFVYITDATARLVGNLDPSFINQGGDSDYGLRAQALGVRVWLMPGTIGCCRSNPPSTSWRAPGIGIRERWRRGQHPSQGLPWGFWIRFARRHGGPFWLLYALWAYRRLVWPTTKRAVPTVSTQQRRAAVRD